MAERLRIKRLDGWMIFLADDAGGWWPTWDSGGETRLEAISNYARIYCGDDLQEYAKRRRRGVAKCLRVRLQP